MTKKRRQFSRPKDIGLAVRRFFVFALPAILIAGAIGGNVVMGALNEKPEEKEEGPKAPPVVVSTAERQEIRLSTITQGEVRPRTEINLASLVSGQVEFVSPNFVDGGAFKKGETLLSLHDAEYQFRVTQAAATVAQAESNYARELAEADTAKRDFEELGGSTPSPLTLREPQLAEAAASLAAAKASLGEAELQLARTKIVAPFDGRITEKQVDVGEFLSPGTPVGRVFSTTAMEVRLPLTDNELGKLGLSVGFNETETRTGPRVTLTANVAGRPHSWSGRIIRTDSRFDTSTRTLFGYAEVRDPYTTGSDNGVPLAAGLFVTAEIDGRVIDEAVVVPRAALRGENQVYVITSNNTLEIRNVEIATSDRNRAVMIGGLEPGERVVTSPVRAPANGMAVTVAGGGVNDSLVADLSLRDQ